MNKRSNYLFDWLCYKLQKVKRTVSLTGQVSDDRFKLLTDRKLLVDDNLAVGVLIQSCASLWPICAKLCGQIRI